MNVGAIDGLGLERFADDKEDEEGDEKYDDDKAGESSHFGSCSAG